MKMKIAMVAAAMAAGVAMAADKPADEPLTLEKFAGAAVLPYNWAVSRSSEYAVREVDEMDTVCD